MEAYSIESVVSAVSRLIAAEIAQYGDERLSMGALRNAFDSSVYGYVKSVGAAGRVAILSANPELLDHVANTTSRYAGDASVGSVIERSLVDAISAKLEPKMLDMVHRIHEGRTGPLLARVADVAEKLMHVQFTGCDSASLEQAYDLGVSIAQGEVPDDTRSGLCAAARVLDALRTAQRDRNLLSQVGVSLSEIAKLSNGVNDLVELEYRDPRKFAAALGAEPSVRPVPVTLKMAA